MPATLNEKWQITVGRNKHIVSGEEMAIILGAGDSRFVKFRDIVINPAFVSDMVLVERTNPLQLEAPPEVEITQEQRDKNLAKLKAVREELRI